METWRANKSNSRMDKHRLEMFIWLIYKLDIVDTTKMDVHLYDIFRSIAKQHAHEDNMAARERVLGYAAHVQAMRIT